MSKIGIILCLDNFLPINREESPLEMALSLTLVVKEVDMDPVKLFMIPSEKFVKVDHDITVQESVKIMSDHGIGSIFVKRQDSIIGILSDTDVIQRLVAIGGDPSHVTIEEIMSAPIPMIDEDQSLQDANDQMAKEHIRHLGISKEGKLVGMISIRDVLVGLTVGPSSVLPPSWVRYQEGVRAYERGDYDTAMKQFGILAEQGVARAQYHMGSMFQHGQGVPQNDVQAFMWAILATVAGFESAVVIQKELMKGMPHDQIMKAERLAKEWQPQGK